MATARAAMAVVTLGFVVSAVAYGWMNPLFEAPDELWHFMYVEHLKSQRSLPIATRTDTGLGPRQEATQPPLYYALAALATATLDSSDLASVLQFNPQYDARKTEDPQARGFLVHTERENPRYSHFARAAHADRLLSTLLGAGTILLTYALGRLVFPGRTMVALGGAAITAFNPQFVFLSASINNDNAIIFFSTLTLFLLARLLVAEGKPPGRLTALYIGVTIGLACLSKLTGVGLLLLATLVLVYLRFWSHLRLPLRNNLLLVIVGWLAVSGWWYLRNFALYGDPLATQPMIEMVGQGTRPIFVVLGDLVEVFHTYWASFGWSTIKADEFLYTAAAALCLLAVVGVCRAAGELRRPVKQVSPAGLALLGLWIALMVILLLRWMYSIEAPQGRLLFPASAAISLVLSCGLLSVVPRFSVAPLALSTVALAAATTVSLFTYIIPAHPIWPISPAAAAPLPARESHVTFGDEIELLGISALEKAFEPGDRVPVDLQWHVIRQSDHQWTAYTQLVTIGTHRRIAAAPDQSLGLDGFPASWWRPNDVVRETRTLQVFEDADVPTVADLIIGMYDHDPRSAVGAKDKAGRTIPYATPTRLILRPSKPVDLLGTVSSQRRFEGGIEMVAFTYTPSATQDGKGISARLIWRTAQPIGRDLHVFLRLGEGDQAITQYDAQPRGGDYPTTVWQPGEMVPDTFVIPLQQVPPGSYPLRVGLYDPSTGQRLTSDGQDVVELGQVEVTKD